MTDKVRKLTTVETVVAVTPIEGADNIEVVTVRGWTVITRKGEFTQGDRCVYFEIDAFLPVTDPRFAFLADRGTKEMTGVTGHVLRTIRLRGTYSQGLVLPLSDFPELTDARVGDDVSAALGVSKWEPPVPVRMQGKILNPFPSWLIPRTDAERVQNLVDVYDELLRVEWVATEKIDGTSLTVVHHPNGELSVCSRNWELARDDANANVYWEAAERHQLAEIIPQGWAIQGEIYGEGVQANPLGVKGRHLAIFAVWDVNRRPAQPLPRHQWPFSLTQLAVPVYAHLGQPAVTVADALTQADGIRSTINPDRLAEGIVWHTADAVTLPVLDYGECFKAISNKYLAKHHQA